MRSKLEALLPELAALGQAGLQCDAFGLRAFVLQESDASDEAFRAAQATERCAQALGDVELQVAAVTQMGTLANTSTAGEAAAVTHFQRALALLAGRPARYLRSVIEWELGKAIDSDDKTEERQHLERARALSAEIGDEVGEAIAASDLAFVALQAGQPAEALPLARRARELFRRHGVERRLAATYATTLAALTQLHDATLPDEITAVRSLGTIQATLGEQAHLARDMAKALASLGRHREAYDELQRSVELYARAHRVDSERNVQRLQAAHEAAQRDADNARLRLRDESSRLKLEASTARQRTQWAVIASLALALAYVGTLARRTWLQRRELADLALRDELTGAPNRRAVMAIGQAQWALCRRLRMTLGVAMIDLDHFKRVNDTYGHEVGDHTLRAFAALAMDELREQDRIGRYGGEEWLLVMPGAGRAELEAIFARLSERYAIAHISGLPIPHGQTFSMGAAFDDGSNYSLKELIAESDQRLYVAKAQGRNRLVADVS